MGTNYYLHEKEVCQTCGHDPSEPLHIGKSSAGWCFSLHVSSRDDIRSLDDWIERWSKPGVRILDEYGTQITPDEMLRIITDRKAYSRPQKTPLGYASWAQFHAMNHSAPGPEGLVRHQIDGRHCLGHGDGTFDFIAGEFS